MSVIGILPAAGWAERLNGLPKFLLPVPEGNLLALHCERMLAAGAARVLIGTRWINSGLASLYAPAGTETYLVNSKTMAETVLAARGRAGDSRVLFGMPDTYWDSPAVYESLVTSPSDVTLACWRMRPDQRGKLGQCDIDNNGRVWNVRDKDALCLYEWAWGALAWNSEFWRFIKPDMPHIGYALQPAIDAGLSVTAVFCPSEYHDCGTFESYARLCSTLTKEVAHV